MQNDIQIFKNELFGEIRTVQIESEPWFVAKDVAGILGYSDTEAMTRRLDNEDLISYKLSGMNMNSNLINESGLYASILGSKKTEAKKFKKWVTSEVLPSIRKTGSYSTTPKSFAEALRLAADQAEQIEVLELENKQREQIINELKPQADYTNIILRSKRTVTITQIAKDYGMSAQEMNHLLHDLGVQYKQSGQWLLYGKYQRLGYTHSETCDITRTGGYTDFVMNTKWTQKGRLFIYDLLKSVNIIPLIECELAS